LKNEIYKIKLKLNITSKILIKRNKNRYGLNTR